LEFEAWTAANLENLTPDQIRAAVAVAIAAGTLYCFLGYRVLKFVVALTGFALAGSVAGAIAGFITYGKLMYMGVAACLGGVCGAFALLFLYKVGILCLGSLGGTLVAMNVLAGRPEAYVTSVIIAAAVFGGLSALVLERPVMTVTTAAIGGWVAIHGLAFFILGTGTFESLEQSLASAQTQRMLMIGWALLGIMGAITQFATHRPPPVKNA